MNNNNIFLCLFFLLISRVGASFELNLTERNAQLVTDKDLLEQLLDPEIVKNLMTTLEKKQEQLNGEDKKLSGTQGDLQKKITENKKQLVELETKLRETLEKKHHLMRDITNIHPAIDKTRHLIKAFPKDDESDDEDDGIKRQRDNYIKKSAEYLLRALKQFYGSSAKVDEAL